PPPLHREPPPFPCRSRLPAQFPIAAVHSAKIHKDRRTLPAPKGTAPPSPIHSLPSEPAAAVRLEFVSLPANPAPASLRRALIVHTIARFPVRRRDSPPGSKASA